MENEQPPAISENELNRQRSPGESSAQSAQSSVPPVFVRETDESDSPVKPKVDEGLMPSSSVEAVAPSSNPAISSIAPSASEEEKGFQPATSSTAVVDGTNPAGPDIQPPTPRNLDAFKDREDDDEEEEKKYKYGFTFGDQEAPAGGDQEGGGEGAGGKGAGKGRFGGGNQKWRVNFLKKLSYTGVWVPCEKRPPQHQTVIIFDWDDTLLCTSFLNLRLQRGHQMPQPIIKTLQQLEKVVKHLLELALQLGIVFIITNAMKGWVEYSANKYIPGVFSVLQRITVISARGNYEDKYPGNYTQWKVQAFLEVQRRLNSSIITNLISLGDSNIEMDAVHIMGKEFSQALVKTIKFRENPTPQELVKQLELVAQKFQKIIENAKNLKIGLEKKMPAPGQSSSPTGDGGDGASSGGEGSRDYGNSSASGNMSKVPES